MSIPNTRRLGAAAWIVGATLLTAPVIARTDPSNELHPDWSPDGATLVFESDREGNADIFVLDLESGDERRLTVSPWAEARPVWSPDGRWIAFHSDRTGSQDLYIVRPDGTDLRRLTHSELDETNASFSPDSSEIVFERKVGDGTWHLFVLHLGTLEERPLVARPGSHLTPHWTAAGTIAFSYSPPDGNHDTDLELLAVDPASGAISSWLGGRKGNSNVDVSPTRGEIAFNSIRDGDWEIYTAEPGGGLERRLTTSGGEDLLGIDGQPAWSPSGDALAITSGAAGSLDIVLLSADGSDPRNLTAAWRRAQPSVDGDGSSRRLYHSMSEPTWSLDGVPGSDSPPGWTRDGREILFQQTREEGIAQIWAVRPDGGGLRRLTDATFRAGHPDACAVADSLALVSDRDGDRQIWMMNLDGSDLRRLTTGGAPKAWPAFSPDCSEIVFAELSDQEAGRYDLRVVDATDGSVRTLLPQVRYLGWPRWSADGRWVIFHREIEGYPNHLWRVRPDGNDAAPLSGGDHGDYWAVALSRDGRRMTFAFSRRHQLEWGGNADLWLMETDSGACRRLAGEPWHEHGARPSPDGARVAYWDARSGYNEIHVLDLETGHSRQLTRQPPRELTRVARERGPEAAIAHLRAHSGHDLAAEPALAAFLRRRAEAAEEPSPELAALYRELFPESRRAREALARELFRAGSWAAARAAYLGLMAETPGDADVGARLAALGLLESSTARPLADLERQPPTEVDINRLGYVLLRMDRFAEAIDLFGLNARRHPESANVWDSLGEAFYWSGATEAARRSYRRALELDPDSANAVRFLERLESPGAPSPELPCPEPPDGRPRAG